MVTTTAAWVVEVASVSSGCALKDEDSVELGVELSVWVVRLRLELELELCRLSDREVELLELVDLVLVLELELRLRLEVRLEVRLVLELALELRLELRLGLRLKLRLELRLWLELELIGLELELDVELELGGLELVLVLELETELRVVDNELVLVLLELVLALELLVTLLRVRLELLVGLVDRLELELRLGLSELGAELELEETTLREELSGAGVLDDDELGAAELEALRVAELGRLAWLGLALEDVSWIDVGELVGVELGLVVVVSVGDSIGIEVKAEFAVREEGSCSEAFFAACVDRAGAENSPSRSAPVEFWLSARLM